MHDTVFDQPTAAMYQPVPDCPIVRRRAGGLGGSDNFNSFKLRYYVTTAAGKIAVNWIQLCYN